VHIPRPGPVAAFGDSINLLRGLDVPTSRLASLFQTSNENIRQADSRLNGRTETVFLPVAANDLIAQYRNEAEWSRLRSKADTGPAPTKRARLDHLEASVVEDSRRFAELGTLLEGASALRLYLPYVARACAPEVLRVRAIVNKQIAWFCSHSGCTRRSIRHALEAMRASLTAFDESLGDRRHLVEYSESALIAANSLLLAHRPRAALRLIGEADAACLGSGMTLGSEHYRQRAVALFQIEKDEEAAKLFQLAKNVGSSTHSELDLALASDRPLAVIHPLSAFESAMNLAERIEAQFGFGSLEQVMIVNWCVAAAFRTADDRNLKTAMSMLSSITHSSMSFGHQATISYLLSISPALRLSPQDQYRWIRFLLYENSSRTK